MQLKQLRKTIERHLVHAPGVEAHREEMTDRLNDAMRQLMTENVWPFRDRFHTLRLKKERLFAEGSYALNAGGNVFAISFAKPATWSIVEATELLEGHTAVFTDNTGAEVLGPFVIERAGILAGVIEVILDPRYIGGASVPVGSSLRIQFLRYKLPVGVEDVHVMMLRDSDDGPIYEMANATESRFMLNSDDSPGRPVKFINNPNRSTSRARHTGFDYPHDLIEPPHAAPTLTPSGGGALPLLATFEYRYSWAYAGLVSEPSPPSRITLSGPDNAVAVGALEATDADRGRTKLIFRRQIITDSDNRKRPQPWFKVGTETDPTSATFSDGGTFTTVTNPTAVTRERDYLTGGSNHFIRTWPPTDTDIDAELRYLARVERLETDADVPGFPSAHHPILAHMVTADVAMEQDARRLSEYHERKVRALMRIFKRRELTSSAERHQRRMILMDNQSTFVSKPPVFNG